MATDADIIKAIRERTDVVQKDTGKTSIRLVAREIGVSPSYLHDVINERRGVSLRIAGLFGYKWEDGRWKKIGSGK